MRYAVPAFAGATTASLLGATSVPLGLVAGTLAGGLLAWGTRRSGRATVLGPADIDIAFVRRALGRGRSTSKTRFASSRARATPSALRSGGQLQLLRSALRAQTALVLWNDAATRSVRMRGFDTSRDDLVVGHWPDGKRIARAPRAGGEPALCNDLDAGRGLLPWYPSRDGGHAIVIRLLREGVPLGYLVVDRAPTHRALTTSMLALQTAAEQVALTIRMEMLVVEAASARREMAILDAAAARLNSALTPDDVSREAADLFARVLDIDAFVTALDEANAQQRVPLHTGRQAFPHPRRPSLRRRRERRRARAPPDGVLALFGPHRSPGCVCPRRGHASRRRALAARIPYGHGPAHRRHHRGRGGPRGCLR